ncbi:hypothetical protein IC620_08660 [Hazenella sp. IB182357]|uniref:Uncharacterized protein n=1 Tax=Polycladospora coralii TaxID=2771432 RepID=A0A926N9U7_9BACL|nr:hypothetical protein [Polycladospora coralii]MBD1372428.1 hypothetical protein [Polycladospora coralii]
MNQNVKEKWYELKEYLPTFRKVGTSKKGSPTMEYIVIIGVGALFAMILYNVFATDENGGIAKELKNKVMSVIKGGDGGTDENTAPTRPSSGHVE